MLCMIDIQDKLRMFLPWDELEMNEGINMNL